MNEKNLQNLITWLNSSIQNGYLANDIRNRTYQSQYLEIFFNEIKNNEPLSFERFREDLASKLERNSDTDNVLEAFITRWEAWCELYQELARRRML